MQQIERDFGRQYKNVDLSASQRSMVDGAEGRWRNSVAAFEDALKVQAGVVGNLNGARTTMQKLVTASQSATGALQAAQAGNQLLALQSQQLADLTATMAALDDRVAARGVEWLFLESGRENLRAHEFF